MDYKLVSYTDDFYHFVYDLKKTVYKKYVEECWGEWNEAAQNVIHRKAEEPVFNSLLLMDKKDFMKNRVLKFCQMRMRARRLEKLFIECYEDA